MMNIHCPLCKNYQLDLLASEVRFGHQANVYLCKKCNLKFLDPLSFKYPKDFYEKEYHQTYITHVEPAALDPQSYYEKMLKSTKIWADRVNSILTGKEAVLDVGCSTGHFLQHIKSKAAEVYGFDLNKKEVAFCKDALNLDVSDEPLETRFNGKKFDYITLIYVLEHIAEPVEFLKDLSTHLKQDGKFIILVPNANDALVNFYDIPEYRKFYYCIEHLYYFTPETIKNVFAEANLQGVIETLQEYPLANHLNWGYRRKPSDTLASRMGLPDITISAAGPSHQWTALWNQFNAIYKTFLKENGYEDRIWAVVGLKKVGKG